MEIQKEGQAAAAKIWKFVYGFADCLVLRCAIDLGIADIIHKQGEPLTLSELGAQIPVQPVNTDHLHRLMRYLVHMKIFTKETLDGEARYGLAPPAKFIVKGWDKSIVSIILVVTDKDFMAPWHCLKDSLCGEGTAFEKALGRSIWTYMADHPEKNKLFNEGMACDTKLLISALVQDCKDLFQGIMSLVDVGGGTGTAMRAIAKAFPHLKCTIYDLPHVIADSPDYPEVDRIAGDMFKHIPSADAILLKVNKLNLFRSLHIILDSEFDIRTFLHHVAQLLNSLISRQTIRASDFFYGQDKSIKVWVCFNWSSFPP
uniref:(RS)-norcoclaurine 6-O-methyltransferase-like n=1 Tax=Nelumbo nucifera TaxID=4432 RepID=A0A822XYP8_NELNU|nr:TPA_asm: hypothetical protein HUJ06_025692 [Nelumbo nucifera]